MKLFIVIFVYMSHATTQTLEYDQFTHLYAKCSSLVNFYLRHTQCSVLPPDKFLREHMFPKQFVYTGKAISAATGEVEKIIYVRHLFAPGSTLLSRDFLKDRSNHFAAGRQLKAAVNSAGGCFWRLLSNVFWREVAKF